MSTPKSLLRWYFMVKDSHGAPALSFIDSTGRLYAKHCTKCKAKLRHHKKDGFPVCGFCGAAWAFVDRHIMKGEIQRTLKTSGHELKNAKQFDVGRLVHNLLQSDPIPGHLYVANSMHMPIRQLVEVGPEYWPDWKFSWSRHAVHQAIKQGAELWERSLSDAGIS